MKRRVISMMIAFLLTVSAVFTACDGKKPQEQANGDVTTMTESSKDSTTEGVKAGSLEFPDQIPEKPAKVDPKCYAYDDMSQSYSFEIMLSGHINQPIADDKIKTYLEKKYNVSLKLTSLPGDQFANNAAVKFAAGNAPEFMVVPTVNTELSISLSKQKQTLDATEILKYMPQATMYVTKDYKRWATVDNKMIGIPRYATFMDNWWFYIRADWRKELNLNLPTTEEELFEYAKAVTTQDPDKNGKDDTWFMGTASGGSGFGMMNSLRAMFGHMSFNEVDGKINHPMLDGSERKFVEFIKRLKDANLLPPDWFTAPWNQFKSVWTNDKIGMIHYPGWNLVDEYYTAKGRDAACVDDWEPLGVLKSNDGKGGLLPFGGIPGGMYVFSKKAAESEGKLKRIAHLIDTLVYPNDNYWAASQGGGVEIFSDAGTIQKLNPDGTNVFFIDQTKHPAYVKQEYAALADWQWIGYTLLYQVYDDEPVGKAGAALNSFVKGLPKYRNYDLFLTFEPRVIQKTSAVQLKNEINFIMGRRDMKEWDQYVEEWKKAGGQQMIDLAATQLGLQK